MGTPELTEPALRPRRERARSRAGRIAGLVIGGVLVVALGIAGAWVLSNPQRITDQFTVWNFSPSPAIASYADRSTMTDEGRFLFYASRPEVAGKTEFDGHCSTETEGVGILGCYLHADKRIYLFDVTDDRLDGIEDVVAAHEMLHAAWDRLGAAERDRLSTLLEAEAAKMADDPAFSQTLEYYAKAEPGERINELHSIIGTEFRSVSPELEAYYARFFRDRGALVGLHEKSDAVFQAQQDAITELVAQIDELQAGVDADYATYNAGYDQLNADISAFNTRAEQGSFSSQAQFTAERNALVSRQADLDALYATIDDRAQQYKELVAQLDDLNAQVDELNESINIAPRSADGTEG